MNQIYRISQNGKSYNIFQNNSEQMRHFRPKMMIDSLFRMSPHACQQRLSKISLKVPKTTRLQQQLAKQLLMRQFEYTTFCQYITNPIFQIHQKPLGKNLLNTDLYGLSKPQKQKQKEISPLQRKILHALKNLNEKKNQFTSYFEAEEIILSIKPEQAQKNKKLLTYIYKWVLSQREWSNPELEKLGLYLKNLVIKKIQEGYSQSELEKVKKQLLNLQQRQKKIYQIQKKKKKKANDKLMASRSQKSGENDKKQ